MKKLTSLLLALLMVLSFVACGAGEEENEETKEVQLTKENLLDYVNFTGDFKNARMLSGLGLIAAADIDFQAYPIEVGSFKNVEIVLKATNEQIENDTESGAEWYLHGDDKKQIELSFKLGVDGKFSKEYAVESFWNIHETKLKGSCEFEILSVSGTFVKG